mgnify:CR=1 FL=1
MNIKIVTTFNIGDLVQGFKEGIIVNNLGIFKIESYENGIYKLRNVGGGKLKNANESQLIKYEITKPITNKGIGAGGANTNTCKMITPVSTPKTEEKTHVKERMSQSECLSKNLILMYEEKRHLTDDSCSSEKILSKAMCEIIPYATGLFKKLGYKIVHEKTISLYECQSFFEKVGGPKPNPENKKVYMKPDGGILFAVSEKEKIPILIVDDKVQGTNDNLFEQKKKKQASGNAVERAGKNIRGAEMLFDKYEIFPCVIFASGCDFHSTETIAKRIEMLNMGIPNHYKV